MMGKVVNINVDAEGIVNDSWEAHVRVILSVKVGSVFLWQNSLGT
jgi:hypothetical protein